MKDVMVGFRRYSFLLLREIQSTSRSEKRDKKLDTARKLLNSAMDRTQEENNTRLAGCGLSGCTSDTALSEASKKELQAANSLLDFLG